jgi:CheY-like chemotaxis protein
LNKQASQNKRVLLVEDEPGVRVACRFMLGIDEHAVTEARNGAEALALFSPGQFDLVITDFEMPVMKGDELALRIKLSAPSQPILMITGYEKQPGAPDNPVDAILPKPFTLHELRCAIEKVMAC